MTCIVAITDDKTVWMGADSAGSNDRFIAARKDPKIYQVGEFLFGFTTSFRMGQILGYSFIPPSIDECDIYEYMCTSFIDELRSCMQRKGFAKRVEEAEIIGTFIVGIRGRIFTIFDDYQVAENCVPYAAVGCGSAYAMGALHATRQFWEHDYFPEQILENALITAEAFSPGVCQPFIFKSNEKQV